MSVSTKVLIVIILILSVAFAVAQMMLYHTRENYGEQYRDAQGKLNEKISQLDEKTKEWKDADTQLRALRVEHKNYRETAEATQKDLNTKIGQRETDLSLERQAVTNLTETVKARAEQLKQLGEQVVAHKQTIIDRETDIGKHLATIAERDGTITTLKQNVTDLEGNVIALKANIKGLEEDKQALAAKLDYVVRVLKVNVRPTIMEEVNARVVAVSPENDIVINKGKRDGVGLGYTFLVYNNDPEDFVLGRFVVTLLQDTSAGGHLQMFAKDKRAKQGDLATTTIDARD